MNRRIGWINALTVGLVLLLGGLSGPGRAQPTGQPALTITGVDTAALPTDQTLTVTVNVTTAAGRAVIGLEPDDFTLRGDLAGRATIERVDSLAADNLPISAALVLDVSSSMAGTPFDRLQAAALTFIDTLRPGDAVGILVFSDRVRTLLPFTRDLAAARAAIAGLPFGGETALHQAAFDAADFALTAPDPRRAIVLFSDGAEFGGASSVTRDEAISHALRLGIPIFSIGLGFGADRAFLQAASEVTNGQFYESPSSDELVTIFRNLGLLFTNQYVLTLAAPDLPLDGSLYSFGLSTRVDGVTVTGDAIVRAPVPVPIVRFGDIPPEIGTVFTLPITVLADDGIDRVTVASPSALAADLTATDAIEGGAIYALALDPGALPPGNLPITIAVTDADGDTARAAVTVVIAPPTATSTLTPSTTPTPTPTPTRTPSFTPTATPTPTVTTTTALPATGTPTPTQSPTVTLTPTITPSVTLTPSVTITPTLTVTPTNTLSPTFTLSPTLTLTPTLTVTPTPSPAPTLDRAATRAAIETVNAAARLNATATAESRATAEAVQAVTATVRANREATATQRAAGTVQAAQATISARATSAAENLAAAQATLAAGSTQAAVEAAISTAAAQVALRTQAAEAQQIANATATAISAGLIARTQAAATAAVSTATADALAVLAEAEAAQQATAQALTLAPLLLEATRIVEAAATQTHVARMATAQTAGEDTGSTATPLVTPVPDVSPAPPAPGAFNLVGIAVACGVIAIILLLLFAAARLIAAVLPTRRPDDRG